MAWLVAGAAIAFLGVRIYDSQRGAPLEPWHTFVPHELHAEEIDQADWKRYLEAEAAVFEEVRTEVTQSLDSEERVPANRYFSDSPIYPGRFAQDWNRSFTLEPNGPPEGVVVLLHGLTDSPYSQRHIAQQLPGAWLRRNCAAAARPRNSPRRAHGRGLGGLDRGDPAGGA